MDKFNSLSRQVARGHQQSELSAMKELNSSLFDAGARYVGVIIVAGYAAFFTMWSSVKDVLSPPCVLWAGMLMVVSTVLFVGFEVAKMTLAAVAHQRIQRVIHEAGQAPLPSSVKEVVADENRRLLRTWKYALVPIVLTGFGSAAILIWAFVLGLWSWYRGNGG